jgi:hypothetical protein
MYHTTGLVAAVHFGIIMAPCIMAPVVAPVAPESEDAPIASATTAPNALRIRKPPSRNTLAAAKRRGPRTVRDSRFPSPGAR